LASWLHSFITCLISLCTASNIFFTNEVGCIPPYLDISFIKIRALLVCSLLYLVKCLTHFKHSKTTLFPGFRLIENIFILFIYPQLTYCYTFWGFTMYILDLSNFFSLFKKLYLTLNIELVSRIVWETVIVVLPFSLLLFALLFSSI
jgi:hypothetical protein